MTVPLGRQYVVELHASPDRIAQVRRVIAAHLSQLAQTGSLAAERTRFATMHPL